MLALWVARHASYQSATGVRRVQCTLHSLSEIRLHIESALVCAFVEDTEPGSSDRLLQEAVAGLLSAAGGCRLVHAQLAVRRLSLNM